MHLKATPPTGSPWTLEQRFTLLATIVGSSMAFIDGSVVNVALNALQKDFRADTTTVQWVVNAYTLVLASLILVGGAFGDLYGRRRIFGLGVLIFTLGSLACGIAPSLNLLICARLTQGLGGALLIPGSLALIDSVFPDNGRGRAVGIWSAATSTVTMFGPTLGGLMVDAASWRLVFLINLPLALLVLWSLRSVPESRAEFQNKPSPDLVGALLVAGGLGAMTYGLIRSGTIGFALESLVLTLGGLLVLGLFLIWESRTPNPMLPLRLFRSAAFAGTNALTFSLYGALGAALFFLPLNLIGAQGYSAAAAGSALLPFSLLLAGLSGVFGGLADKIGPRLPLTLGPILAGVGFALLGMLGSGNYWLTVFPAIVVLGLGMAITVAPLTSTVLGSVSATYAGIASGVNNAVSRAAGLLALAGFTLVMLASFHGSLNTHLNGTTLPETVKTRMLEQSAKLAQVPVSANLEPSQKLEARRAVKLAFEDGFRLVCLWSGALAALAGLIGFVSLHDFKPRVVDA
jgi:EmrB/QacA subfamily drug resistance transporter